MTLKSALDNFIKSSNVISGRWSSPRSNIEEVPKFSPLKPIMAKPGQIFPTLRLESPYMTYVMSVEETFRMHDGRFVVEGTVLAVECKGIQELSKGSYFVFAGATLQELEQGYCKA
jgi:hypothetical protein